MVHMILNQQNLASCYQGQPVEVMRQLRANYEMKRIADMENDELVEVKMRQELFTFFCQQLKFFGQKYSTDEKEDIYISDKVYKLPCFLTKSNKIDYHPALNALKETWALWLTLHEEDINEQKDLNTLKEDLRIVIQEKIENIVNEKPDNFYDFVKVAMDRTYLHMKNQKQDYGALYYWEKVEEIDCVYRAISLYNRAFIKVNLQKGDYKQEAINLLVDAKKAIDVYVSEVSNIATFGNLTQRTQFEPHNKETNLTLQLQTRMNLIKSWTDYIDRSVDKLKELQDANKEAITEEKIVFSLTDNYGKLVTDEMSMLYDYGLSFVFEVKQKPEFCLSALFCALLGVLQVLAGILVCGLTCGVAIQFGMGLISEGVSDVINGVEGMIKGSFSWAEWAISKATSIALSLVTFGYNLLKKASKVVWNVTKELLNGTKSFTSVAQDIVSSGKKLLSSVSTSAKALTSSASKEAVVNSIKGLATTPAKNVMMQSAKIAGKELVKKGALKALEFGFDKAIEALLKEIIEETLKKQIGMFVTNNKELEKTLVCLVAENVPETTLKADNPQQYIIQPSMEELLIQRTTDACNFAIGDHETLQTVKSHLGTAQKFLLKVLTGIKLPGLLKGAEVAANLANVATEISDIILSLPTEKMINGNVIPVVKSQLTENCDSVNDNRREFPAVKTLAQKLQAIVSDEISNLFIDLLVNQLIKLTKIAWENPYIQQCTETLKHSTKIWLDKIPVKNIIFRRTQQRGTGENPEQLESLCFEESSPEECRAYLETLQEDIKSKSSDRFSYTDLELKVLTRSDLLRGQGIQLTIENENGKKLSTEYYPGTNPECGNIFIELQESSCKGKFCLKSPEGASASTTENGLYQALANAIENTSDLQMEIYKEMDQNLDRYLSLVTKDLQRKKLRENYRDAYQFHAAQ